MLSFFADCLPCALSSGRGQIAFGNGRLIRQILISLVIVGAAAAAYVFLVPGAPEQLAKFGITIPVAEPAVAATGADGQTGGGNAPAGAGGQGGANGQRPAGAGARGGARAMVVVTQPVVLATINDKLTAIGEGAAAHSVTVMSPATGTLAELSVQPGQDVAAFLCEVICSVAP